MSIVSLVVAQWQQRLGYAGLAVCSAGPDTSASSCLQTGSWLKGCYVQIAEAAGYDEETVMVGRALQKDFEQRGVHLDSEGQSRALKLSEDISTLGMAICKPLSFLRNLQFQLQAHISQLPGL